MSRYPNAPIIEALIEISVRLPDGTGSAQLELAQDAVRSLYPTKGELEKSVLSIGNSGGPDDDPFKQQTSKSPLFVSENGSRIWQSRLDGFTFSQMKPYDTWETFREAASQAWSAYRNATKPESIKQITLKYVNRLDLPAPVTDLKTFLNTAPDVPTTMPNNQVQGLFMQLQLPQPDLHSMLVFTEATVPPPQIGTVSVVLDIALLRRNNVPQAESEIWTCLDALRTRKNDVFEATITDAARELFR